jgi:hypothetical protein
LTTTRRSWTTAVVLAAALVAGLAGPSSPTRTAAAAAPSSAYLLAAADGFLYAYGAEPGPDGSPVPVLHVADLRAPGGPVWLGATRLPGSATSLAAAGGRVYAGSEERGVWVVDAVEPARPAVVGTYPTAGAVWGLAADGARVVATDRGGLVGTPATLQHGGLHVIDVADPARPQRASFMELGDALDVALVGSLAHVAAFREGLRTVDLADPTAAVVVGTYDAPLMVSVGVHEYRTVAAAGRPVYVSYVDYDRSAVRGSGLDVVGVAEPTRPTAVGRLLGPPGIVDVLRSAGAGYAFRTEGDLNRTLRVYALGSACPAPMAGHALGSEAVDALVVGTVLYAATGTGGLRVLPLADTRPTPTPSPGRSRTGIAGGRAGRSRAIAGGGVARA